MEDGTCRLCVLRADLCDSHYIPRVMYKYSRAKQLKTPHPVVVSGDTVRQGTDQARDYVFCKECENRFRVNGERWVLANIPHDYGEPFPLHAAANAATLTIVEPDRVLIPGRTTSGFEMDKLIYFGASIFWRGAAHQWKLDGSDLARPDLGVFQELLRLFLLGIAGFPADVFLTVMLWPYQKVPPAALMPDSSPVTGWQRYWFYITGLGFVLDFGPNIPKEIQTRSTSHSPERLITISKEFADMVLANMKESTTDIPNLDAMLKEIVAIRSGKN
jgi:hypothetical protein